MKLNIQEQWSQIKEQIKKNRRKNMFVSIASVNADNEPTVTPIGSLFLNNDFTGFYFEKFASKLGKNSLNNKKICVLSVNNGKWFWLKSLFKGRFNSFPGIKLYGELGEKREATEKEKRAMQKRVSAAKGLKGYDYLWKDMSQIREIVFTKAEAINLARMTRNLK
ncbi:Pyridoxamine 5'-phosphate oxidase [Tenacibaculum sp. MAR_2009_124]|uniref:pyridoxamine 5'-phosphate oxidase family protein n=1 Tax=Tenacibaculum sp. MAR_2009_124 TaxID=1250059 RepID=UPI00089554F6|nr:pyridoxamine 5'-phosphate oxidase family protein [Tenacibaculum sp. MAR_2009_124]SEC84469.1 Pyridoxamine 5'-phosphate oxidase [Tenacibaculum sp. MAR_2009_124]